MFPKMGYIKWYDYLWLWLLRTHMCMDGGTVLFYKRWKSKIYVLGMWGKQNDKDNNI